MTLKQSCFFILIWLSALPLQSLGQGTVVTTTRTAYSSETTLETLSNLIIGQTMFDTSVPVSVATKNFDCGPSDCDVVTMGTGTDDVLIIWKINRTTFTTLTAEEHWYLQTVVSTLLPSVTASTSSQAPPAITSPSPSPAISSSTPASTATPSSTSDTSTTATSYTSTTSSVSTELLEHGGILTVTSIHQITVSNALKATISGALRSIAIASLMCTI